MKKLLALILILCFVTFVKAQQKTTAKPKTASIKTSTPTLVETLEWLKSKIELYPSNVIERVTFNWDENYRITMTKYFIGKHDHTFNIEYDDIVESTDPSDRAQTSYDCNIVNEKWVYEFDLSTLNPTTFKYAEFQITLSTNSNYETIHRVHTGEKECLVKYIPPHGSKASQMAMEGMPASFFKSTKENTSEPFIEDNYISIYRIEINPGEEPNLIDRMQKAFNNAIAKCPKKQTNEKF